MKIKKYNKGFREIISFGLFLILFGITLKAFATPGISDLIMTVRIGDLHGGVLTYDASINPVDFGLKVESESFSGSSVIYFPPNGIIQHQIPGGLTYNTLSDVTLTCEPTRDGDHPKLCRSYLEEFGNNYSLNQSITIKPSETSSLDFVVNLKKDGINPNLNLDLTTNNPNYTKSNLITFVGRLASKSNQMLDWVLKIKDTGFYNQQINAIYAKVINIINGFLVIILLVIALIWNFSFLISNKILKKMLVYFAIISIIINFTLPVLRLSIDLAEAVQGSFLTKTTGEKIEAKDLLAVNLSEDWTGEAKHSWDKVGIPFATDWKLIAEQTGLTDFSSNPTGNTQFALGVTITPKGNGPTNFLTQSDCLPANRKTCAGGLDCTNVYAPNNCTIGENLTLASCDYLSNQSQWVLFKIKCIKTD